MKYIDLRSDTVTKPTQEMLDAMYRAEVGDDVYEDDPTVNELEKLAAETVGKEAALFVPSGTFGNQLAVFTHCRRGDEIILGDEAHIFYHEVGAAAAIAGVQTRTVPMKNGQMDPDEVRMKIREDDIHYPETRLICLENALSNGMVMPVANMRAIYQVAKEANISVHMDGARVFNAAASLSVPVTEITACCDTVMFCLSKGLCAPIGSILAGPKEFIQKARKARKLMGGGLRQAGYLAAPGIIAIRDMTKRLHKDHENAKLLGQKLSEIPGIEVLFDCLQINMVFFSMKNSGYDSNKLIDQLLKKGIKANPEEDGLIRFVTHYWVTKEDVLFVADTIKSLMA